MKKKSTQKKAKKPTEENKSKVKGITAKISDLRKTLLKQFGANIIRNGSDLKFTQFPRISTGSIEIDDKIGGGIPVGSVIHIAGAKSSGKSTLAQHIAERAQNYFAKYQWIKRSVEGNREIVETFNETVEGLSVAYIDLEGTFDTDWAERIGVDIENLIYIPASGLEEVSDLISALQKNGIGLIILDSVDTLISQKDEARESGESLQMGEKQKEMGRILRKFVSYNNKLAREGKVPCTMLLLNQLRDKIGVMYGATTFAVGGKAIEFYSSIELYLRAGEHIKAGTGKLARIIGREVKFKTEKNKTYMPFQEGAVDLYFKDTFPHRAGNYDNAKSIVLLCVEYDIIERAGAWYKLDGENLAQGAQALTEKIRNDEELFEDLQQRLYALIQSGGAEFADEEEIDEEAN